MADEVQKKPLVSFDKLNTAVISFSFLMCVGIYYFGSDKIYPLLSSFSLEDFVVVYFFYFLGIFGYSLLLLFSSIICVKGGQHKS